MKPIPENEYDIFRDKWNVILTGGTAYHALDPVIAAQINTLTATASSNWITMEHTPVNYLWSDLASTVISRHITKSYSRLKTMAIAYVTKGSELENNSSLLHDIKIGLAWLYNHRYNESQNMYDNEWDWKMGIPLEYNDIMVLLYADLISTSQMTDYMAAVGHYSNDTSYHGVSTGANRTWRCIVVAIFGIVTRNSEKLDFAKKELVNPTGMVFNYVIDDDGFYRDGSFIQHHFFPYTGGYGIALLTDLSNFIYLFAGSAWEVPGLDDVRNCVYKWVYDAFEPLMYKGAMMDMSRGREISRYFLEDHASGHKVIQAIIRISQFAPVSPVNHAAAFKSMVKYWIHTDTFRNFFAYAPINMIILGQAIMNDASITERMELIKHRQFPGMDRAVHLRHGFGFALSMSSSRIHNYESGNSENLKGWYTSDGMTYLYNTDLEQYSGGFWPTVNPYRLPGTTVDTQSRSAIEVAWGKEYANPHNWVGGTSISQLYGISGMQLQASGNMDADGNVGQASSLEMKKSWFMFDDLIVALGSDITSTDGRTIETIVDNRKISSMGNNALIVNGIAKSTVLGWSETMRDVSWIHQAGNVKGSDIGYYFPDRSAIIKGLREARTSSWSAINLMSGTTNPITCNYLTLWFDHGVSPTDASYAYVILPNKTSAQVNSYADHPTVDIWENSRAAHAVKEIILNIVGVNFWTDNLKWVQVDGRRFISSNRKASVMTKETEHGFEVAVSDPTQANTGTIVIEVNKIAASILSLDAGIVVNHLIPTIKFTVHVNEAKGKTFNAKFSYLA
jgi:hyaluronate lyase